MDRDRLIDGSAARVGDRVVGIASSGLHANGYSLVRATLRRTATRLDVMLGHQTLGEALLTPTTIYAAHVLAVIERLWPRTGCVSAASRTSPVAACRATCRAPWRATSGIRVRVGSWPVPEVVAFMARLAELDGPEMRATFNAGIGMAMVVEPAAVPVVIDLLADRGLEAWDIGSVVPDASAGPMRYIEEGG